MKMSSGQIIQVFLVTLLSVFVCLVLFKRAALLFLPFFIILPFILLKKTGSGRRWGQEEDPADWWKKGKPKDD